MAVDYNHPGKKALEKWTLVAEEYLHNGYNQTKAYMKIYPDCNVSSAGSQAARIFNSPPIKEYISKRRKEIYDSMCLDSQHIATEIARIASDTENEKIRPADRLKAWEILYKAAREDERLEYNSKDQVEFIISVDENEDPFEKKCI